MCSNDNTTYANITKSWTSSDRSTQHTQVTVYVTFTTVDVPNTERTPVPRTVMHGKRDSDSTTTRVTSISTNVRSVSDYYTGITPNLIRATAKAAVTTQEAPSQSSKEPKHGRLFRDIT